MVQEHKRATVNVTVIGSISTRSSEIFKFFISLLYIPSYSFSTTGNASRIRIPQSIHNQDNSMKTRSQS